MLLEDLSRDLNAMRKNIILKNEPDVAKNNLVTQSDLFM